MINKQTYSELEQWCNNSVLKIHDVKIKGSRECYATFGNYEQLRIYLNRSKDLGELTDEFKKVCKECGLKRDTTTKALVFLHELGHYFTNSQITNAQRKYFEKKFFEITHNGMSNLDANKIYFRLNQEKMATTWACQFANEHPRLTKRLEQVLAK